jgi:hypothetical protein
VSGGLLVPDVDDPDALLDASVENRQDVSSGEPEEHIDALVLECSGNDLPAVDLPHPSTVPQVMISFL